MDKHDCRGVSYINKQISFSLFTHSMFASQKGDTPLHIAIRGRSRRLAELLLRNPKDGRLLYRPNKAGETPYNIDCSHQKSILTQIFGARKFTLNPAETLKHLTQHCF